MIAAIAGALLLLSLFLAWIGAEGIDSLSGWESQSTLDIYLFILAAFAVVPAVMTMTGGSGDLPFASSATTFLLGAIGSIMMVYLFLDGFPEGVDKEFGFILALLATLAVTVGGWLGMQDEAGAEY
jgi:hypothetical protein